MIKVSKKLRTTDQHQSALISEKPLIIYECHISDDILLELKSSVPLFDLVDLNYMLFLIVIQWSVATVKLCYGTS